jgi:integrase
MACATYSIPVCACSGSPRWTAPEPLRLLGEEPHEWLDRALRAVAERVGAGYRLTGGATRRRGRGVPSEHEVRGVLDAVGRAQGYVGARNRAFFTILVETGCRGNALRTLDGGWSGPLPRCGPTVE